MVPQSHALQGLGGAEASQWGPGGPGCVPCSGLLPTCPLRVPCTCLPRVTGHHRSTVTIHTVSSESHSRLQE